MPKKSVCYFLLFLTACHVGEEYTPQNFVSSYDIQTALKAQPLEKEISHHWYYIFNDDDLNTLLKHALNNNLSIKQGIERLQQSRYNFLIQSKNNFPMLDANANYNYSKANAVNDYLSNVNAFKAGFDVSWELDIWGKGQYITEQYASLMQNIQYSLLNIQVSITAEVINNYIKLREAQEKLRIAQKNLKLQRDILQMVKDKHTAGITDDLALNQAEYTVETTKSSIPTLTAQIDTYKNALAVLLGVLPNKLPVNLDKYKKNITADTFKYSVSDLYKLPLGIIQSRPDIMAAEESVRSQNAVINEAITNLYPTISLGATFGFVSSSGRSLFNTDSQVYGYTPALSLPIWHWGQLTNNIELQKHIKDEYILNYNETVLTAVSELKNAITSAEQAYKTNRYNKSSLAKMQNIMSLTKEKYQNGLIDFTDVALAEQNLLAAQNTLITSNAEILQYLTAFYKATGGGYNLQNCR